MCRKDLGQTLGPPQVTARTHSKKERRLLILPSERVAKTHFTKKEKCIKNTVSPIIHALSRGSVADTQ